MVASSCQSTLFNDEILKIIFAFFVKYISRIPEHPYFVCVRANISGKREGGISQSPWPKLSINI